ncbi:50S ribosomal protein L32 [Candidatus Uhrbacteria bacterium]|nr:50S ribosomal protein L32 [Candidatus Uhrbacteria bacterium]MBD3284110.1 50S ribosomal protein L32 [Candidatus Uhrbacteria bacterium]
MSLPSHRHTKASKRRRASHFALDKADLSKDKKSGALHLNHRAAPDAAEYNGKAIYLKPSKRKAEKAAKRLEQNKKAKQA